MENAKSSVTQIKTDAEQLGTVIRNAFSDSWSEVKDHLSDYYSRGKGEVINFEKKVEGKVKENPMKAVLIAAASGLIAGLLLKRSCHD